MADACACPPTLPWATNSAISTSAILAQDCFFGTGGKAASIAPVAAAVAQGRSEGAAVHDLEEVGFRSC